MEMHANHSHDDNNNKTRWTCTRTSTRLFIGLTMLENAKQLLLHAVWSSCSVYGAMGLYGAIVCCVAIYHARKNQNAIQQRKSIVSKSIAPANNRPFSVWHGYFNCSYLCVPTLFSPVNHFSHARQLKRMLFT